MPPETDVKPKESASAPSSSIDGLSLKEWTLEPLPNSGSGTAVVHRPTGRCVRKVPSSFVRGVPHPPFIREEVWEAQRSSLKFGTGDVFVCTYSKCGTTLAEQIVLLLLNGGNADALNPLDKNTYDKNAASGNDGKKIIGKIWTEMAVVDGLPGLELKDDGNDALGKMAEGKARMSAAEFDALPSPRILKTHEPRELFLAQDRGPGGGKLSEGVRVLYVTRNPLDACVSHYYHPKPGVSPASTGCPFDAFAKLWLSDRIHFGGWAAHVKGWWEEYERQQRERSSAAAVGEEEGRQRRQMLWISYEDLVREPHESIRTIAAFLGVDSDDDLVCRVADGCKFDNVKKAAKEALDVKGGDLAPLWHLRKGGTGDWRNHFTPSLRREFEEELAEKFGGRAMGFEYDIGEEEPLCPGRIQES